MEDIYRIPQYLDEPDKMFFFYTDEILAGLITFLVLFFFVNWFVGFLGMIFAVRMKRRYRKTRFANIFQSFFYWHFASKAQFRGLPPASIREYL